MQMYQQLIASLGIPISNEQLIQCALTHRSFVADHPDQTDGLPSNERLEFLGDAVLNLLTASWLYNHFPDGTVGELTRLRAALVKKTTLARFARQFDLGSYLYIGRGANVGPIRDHETLLADAFEALIGAIYLDQGMNQVRRFMQPLIERESHQVLNDQSDVDHRTRLQAWVQQRFHTPPTYRTVDVTGPSHRAQFTIEVWINEQCLGRGMGPSKQAAAQEAARHALQHPLITGHAEKELPETTPL